MGKLLDAALVLFNMLYWHQASENLTPSSNKDCVSQGKPFLVTANADSKGVFSMKLILTGAKHCQVRE